MSATILLQGGDSPEREVSLSGGGMILESLRRLGEEAAAFDPAKRPLLEIAKMKVGRVFNILHGGGGENGEIRGALKTMQLPCTGSDVLGSALAMDKHRAKLIWRAAGIPTPDWRLADSPDAADGIAADLGFPLFVKPSCGGSSTNAAKANSVSELRDAIAAARSEGAPAMAETYIAGREMTAAVLDDKPLPLVAIAASGVFYDYHAKYVSDDTEFLCPCGLPSEYERDLQKIAMRAFALLGCRHWGRVDFILAADSDSEADCDANGFPIVYHREFNSKNSSPMFLEVNTIPGMTSHSLVPMAAKAAGMDYDELVRRILEGAR